MHIKEMKNMTILFLRHLLVYLVEKGCYLEKQSLFWILMKVLIFIILPLLSVLIGLKVLSQVCILIVGMVSSIKDIYRVRIAITVNWFGLLLLLIKN